LKNPTCFAATDGCWGRQSPTQLNAVWTNENAAEKGCVLGFKDAAQLSTFQEALARSAEVKPKKGKKRQATPPPLASGGNDARVEMEVEMEVNGAKSSW
jgi:hypothetical protein